MLNELYLDPLEPDGALAVRGDLFYDGLVHLTVPAIQRLQCVTKDAKLHRLHN